MIKEKLEDLSLDRLRKRKKFAAIVLCIVIPILILSIIILLVDFIGGKQVDTDQLVGVFAGVFGSLVGGIAIYKGIRKINGEICRRESK